jgi:spermidine synthase
LNWYFVFFFISGFCSVLYELVWLRLAMAQFGVTSAMVSIVLSVFMAGMGLGSWASGKWLRGSSKSFPALRAYAIIELLIGVSAIVVPYELSWGRRILESLALTSSAGYYGVAGVWVAWTVIPWCALMGATIPVAMRSIEQTIPKESARSFSYLYLANVTGAVAGTVLPLFLIELLGFHGTLMAGTLGNGLIALAAVLLAGSKAPSSSKAPIAGLEALPHPKASSSFDDESSPGTSLPGHPVVLLRSSNCMALLFLTGLTSMGMEVVWVRQFTPYVGTVVYAFASILGVYLTATCIGSRVYRGWSARRTMESPVLWTLLALTSLFPLMTSSPSIDMPNLARLVLGIAPFTGLLGFLTPMLVDRHSGGDPGKAGSAYAMNVLGCIAGPLMAGFGLLPYVSERWALTVMALPWLVVGMAPAVRFGRAVSWTARLAAYALLPLAGMLIYYGRGYSEENSREHVRRDSTATVIAIGSGMDKQLLVNGYGMTNLTPITKMMAHLPLAFLDRPPQNALDICFGMGTTFRSLLSWKIDATAVELVPSVPRFWGYFHSNAPELMKLPQAHIVIDDGRRYLERTTQQYDLITIDPPPPVEAAGSSMLYSVEFYTAARKRLKPGGILAQWLPEGDNEDFAAVARALRNSFPYVRVFRWGTRWGFHFLASEQPLPNLSAAELQSKLPAEAAIDMAEWAPPGKGDRAVFTAFDSLLKSEVSIDTVILQSPKTPALSDDRPINEYYALRRRAFAAVSDSD